MRFIGYIFFIGLLVILAGFFLFSNLGYERSFKTECADKVKFLVTKQPMTPGDFCYDNRGNMEFVVMNQGDIIITGIIAQIKGPISSTNITIDGYITPTLGNSYSINVMLDKLGGSVQEVTLYPKIVFDGEENICIGNKVNFKDIEIC